MTCVSTSRAHFTSGEHGAEQPNCEGCDGSGVRSPATPSCQFENERLSGWEVVERCDVCERYPDDLVAAATRFRRFRWVVCAQAGHHAVGQM